MLKEDKLPVHLLSNPTNQDAFSGLISPIMRYVYNSSTIETWKVYFQAETRKELPDFHSTFKFVMNFRVLPPFRPVHFETKAESQHQV